MIRIYPGEHVNYTKRYKLLMKTHWETGVNYLCVSTAKNFEKYKGSGKRWGKLIKKYPDSEIQTFLLFESDDKEYFNEVCEFYSDLLEVDNSFCFANLVRETGYDPEICNFQAYYKRLKPEEINKLYKTRSDNLLEKYGVDHISKIPEVVERAESSRKKHFMKTYGVEYNLQIPEVRENIRIKNKKAWAEKELVPCDFCGKKTNHKKAHENHCKNNPNKLVKKKDTCRYCGKEAIVANIKHYHNENCKHKGESND